MALPPLELGAVQLTVAWALPAVALALVGAPGTVAPPAALNTPATMNQGTEVGNEKLERCWPATLLTMSSSPCVPEDVCARLVKVTPWLEPGVSVPAPVVAAIPP